MGFHICEVDVTMLRIGARRARSNALRCEHSIALDYILLDRDIHDDHRDNQKYALKHDTVGRRALKVDRAAERG